MANPSSGVEFSAITTARRANVVSLFTSGSTLICCALPAALIAVGSAATLTSLVTSIPQLIWISEHKPLVFGLAGVMLTIAGCLQWNARNAPCPADLELAAICRKTRRNSLVIYGVSVAVFLIGALFAFIAPLFI